MNHASQKICQEINILEFLPYMKLERVTKASQKDRLSTNGENSALLLLPLGVIVLQR